MDPSAGDAAGELMPAGVDPRAPPAQDDGALEWDAINALIEETGSDSLMLDSGQEAGQPDQGVADGADAAQHMHVEVNEGMQVDPAPELPPMQPTSSSTAPVVQDEALGAAMQDLDITVQAPPPAAADGSQSGHLSSAAATPGVPLDQAVLLALGQTNPPFAAEPVTATNTGGGGIQVAAPMIGRGEAGRNAQRFNTGARAVASMTSIRFSVPTDEEDGASDEDEEGLLSPESRRLAFAAVKFPPPQKCRPTPSKHKQKLKAASGGRVAKPITTGTHSGKFQCDRCLKFFGRRYNLKVHQRTHTGEMPYSCPYDGCSERFKWRSSLSHHRRAFHNEPEGAPMHLPLSASLNIAGNVGSAKSTRSFGETGPSRRAEAGGGQGSQGVVFVQTMNVGQGAPKAAQADKVTAGRALKFKSIPARQDVGISAIGGQRKPVSASENSIASDSTQVRDLMALFAPNQTPSQLDSGNAIDNDGLYDNIVDINSNADIDRNSAAIAQYFSLGGLGLVGSEKNAMETKHVQPDAASQGGRTQVAAVTGNKGGSLTGNTGQATISAQVLRSGAHAHGDPKMMKECFSPVSDTFIAREGAPDRASLPGASSGLHFSSPLSDLVTSTVAEAGANTLDAGTNMLEAGGVDQARAPEGTGSWGSTSLGGARSANQTEEARKMAVLDALLGITDDEVGRADGHISTPPGANEAVIDQPVAIGGAIQNIGDLAFGYEINDAALAGGAEEGQVLTWGMMAVDAFNTPTAAPTLASGAIPDQDVDFF